MPITRRGVYHNLKESKYVVSNTDITFFFSSEHTLNKFMNGYQNYRDKQNKKYKEIRNTPELPLNLDTMHDIEYYKETEIRGFYVWLKGVSIDIDTLYHYSVRMMIEKESPVWYKIRKPKLNERMMMGMNR